MRLYLVRHGASTGNTPGNLLGHAPHPLTPVGMVQARAVAARLAPLGPMPVYCSDLLRARQTAECIAAVWPSALPGEADGVAVLPLDDPRLRELDLGRFEGRSWDEFLGDEELNAAMIADPLHTALPGGESLAQMKERVLAAIDDIVARHAAEAGTPPPSTRASVPLGALTPAGSDVAVCVVAHDGPLRVILNHFLGVLPEKWWALTTTHGGLSMLEWSNGWVNVRFVNGTSHLAGVGGKTSSS